MNSIEIDLVYGLVGILLYIYMNPDKKHLYLISSFVCGLFVSQAVYYLDSLAGQIVWIVSASGLLVAYSIRLSNKGTRNLLDVLKVMGVLLLTIYPLPFYSLVDVGDSVFWTITRLSTFFVLGIIYLYDRWILKPEKMKKKYLIVLTLQSVVILLMLMYAFVQKAEADKQHQMVQEQFQKAEEMQKKMLEIEVKYQELVKENAR